MASPGQDENWTHDPGGYGAGAGDSGEPIEIVLDDRFRLYPDRPVPQFDSPTAKAYAATDARQPERRLFCLACDPAVPPRRALVERLLRHSEPGCLIPIAEAACPWPPLGRGALILLYEQPGGMRLESGQRLEPDVILERLLPPVGRLLQAFERHGFAHRAIRPDNLFWSDPERRSIVLGDWLSAPPGYAQPAVFEAMEHAGAHPAGRGAGSTRDDMFALGMTVLALCGAMRNPDAPADDMLFRRAGEGSAAALVDEEMLPPALAVPIRAMLCDDPAQRWTPDALLAWLGNERVPPLRAGGPPRGGRPFIVGGRAHATLQSLALGLAASDTGAAALRDGEVERWLRGAARSEKAADGIESLLASVGRAGQREARADDVLTCRASLILDPAGPLRFGSLSLAPESLGTVLYARMAAGESTGEIRALLEANIPAWLPAGRLKALPGFDGWIGRMQSLLSQRKLGAGIERCLYEMNPDLPCLGPTVSWACVLDLPALLDALEDNARAADYETTPIDAHVAAFALSRLAARRMNVPSAILDAATRDRPLFELGLLASVQQADGGPPRPLLSRWLAHRVRPRLEKLHNRRVRRRLLAELQRRGEAGDLTRVLDLVRHPGLWEEDERGLTAARLQHLRHEQAARDLDARRDRLLAGSLAEGQELALTIAASLSIGLASLGLILQMAG